jgi:hypothetical protein
LKKPGLFCNEQYLFRSVLSRTKRGALLGVADRLSQDLGRADDEDSSWEPRPATRAGWQGSLDPEDEDLVASLRAALARIAAALDGGAATEVSSGGVISALDHVELMIRGTLLIGRADRLTELLPGFVFMVALPVAEHGPALELSRRSERMIEQALEGRIS